MKKCISILALLAIVTTGAFAQISMSAGGGGLFGLDFLTGDESGSTFSFGAFGFFDATFVEADIAFSYGTGLGDSKNDSGMALSFAVLGKYPFDIGIVNLFPLLGARLNVPLVSWTKKNDKREKDNDAGDANLGLQLGAGVDYDLSSSMFLRASLLFNIDFKSFGKDHKDEDAIQSVGPMLKVGVGFRL